MRKLYFLLLSAFIVLSAKSQTTGIAETSAPNNTPGTAQAITSPAKVKGNIYPNADIDYFSFTAVAGDRVYAAVITSSSSNASTDGQLRLFASDGTTLIEFDEDDGSFGSLSSGIAGATIPSSGTYYLEVKHFSATNQLRGYDLYLKVQTGSPTAEVESNDTPGTANAMPGSGWVSGARNPAAASEQDWFSVTLAAGESVFISMDLDPERDNVQYNGRLGFALFGDATNQILVVDDASTGSVANPLAESFVFTAKDAGTYYVFADASSAATGGPTATYNISYTKFAANGGYTNYVSADIPKVIGPANGSVTSTLNIADNKRIKDFSVRLNLDHTLMGDIDAVLTTPQGNSILLFTDIGAAAIGGQAQMDLVMNDNNAIPPIYTVMKGVGFQPELNSKLDLLKNMSSAGTWTLTLYDDNNNASGGNLISWSIDILEDNTPDVSGASTVFTADFEASDNGFTHSGTGDQWARGVPNTPASGSIAAFTTANSGVNCWKTNLTGGYNASTDQTLLSPSIALPVGSPALWLSWAMRYQVENVSFDKLVVSVQQVGNPASNKILFEWLGATPTTTVGSPSVTIPGSSGWGTYFADVSSFAGQNIEFMVMLTTDASVHLGGVAIDDVKVYSMAPSNDDCANAIPIACGGTATGSTASAAIDGPPTSCAALSVAPDVWYTVVGNGGSIQASLCGSAYDTKIEVYTGTCGALVCVGGNDDFCGLQSQFTWVSVPATTYYIRVHGFAGATGNYTLNVNCSPTVTINQAPAQADPTAVSPIDFEVIFSEAVSGFDAADIVLGGTAGATTAIVTGGPTVYNVAVSGMTLSGTVTASIPAGSAASIASTMTNLASTSTDNEVTFLLSPPNDDCINATPIACGQTLAGSNINANPDVAPVCNAGTVNPGVWYSFVGSGFTETFSTCTGASFDTKIAIYTGSCGALVCVDGNDDFCGLLSQVSVPTTLGTTYYVFVNGFAGATGTFSLSRECCPVVTVDPVPDQTFCNAATTPAIIFTGPVPGTGFSWTNNNTSIGLAANGTGNIPSFTATNATIAPVVATITVTPTFTGCPDGAPIQFTITVMPTPTVNVVPNQTVCHNAPTTAVVFSGTVPGTIYNWTNNTPSIGLAANGTGNIPSFIAQNPGAVPVTATITVTPTVNSAFVTNLYNFTGAFQTWVVPAGVTSVSIQAFGAQGNASALNVAGGLGGTASGNLAVAPGNTLYIYAGGGGTSTINGGFNGGGNAGNSPCLNARGGGGGGASDIRLNVNTLAGRVLVAGGGGGAGGNRVSGCGRGTGGGGGAGYYGGGGGAGWPGVPPGGPVPTGGTQAAGGVGGITTFSPGPTNGLPGALGIGGAGGVEISSAQGGNATAQPGGVGGGLTGGNGLYNSANNWTGHSGAGGSSYIGGVTGGATASGARTGNGMVSITYQVPGAIPVMCSGTPRNFTITVNPMPTITCPANIVVNNTPGQCGAFVSYSVVSTGPPAPTLSYSFSGATTGSGSGSGSGSLFNVGVTTVTVTATNTCGAVNCSFTITVNDVQPPTIVCPANMTVGTDPGICGAVVNFNLPAVTDNCPLPGNVVLSQSTNRTTITGGVGIACGAGDNHFWRAYPLALANPLTITGVRFGVEVNGTAQVATVKVYTSAGAFPGGTRTQVASQTVNLTTAPAAFYTVNFATPAVVPGNAIVAIEIDVPTGGMWPGANTLGESAPSYISSATCGVATPVTLASLGFTSHFIIDLIGTVPVVPPVVQQTAGLPSGSTFPVGTTTNSFLATDAAGNTATCSFTVTVNDTEQPAITCPANQTRNTDPGVCYATYTPPQPTFSDNCAVTRLTWAMTGATTGASPVTGINYVPSTQFGLTGTTGVGVTTITYTAADAAGNTRNCSFTVTVNDASIPVISVQPATRFVCAGSDAVFSVTASAGAGNPLAYQWQTWNGSAWVNIPGATASTLTLPAVSFAMNTNTYRVVLTGRCSVVNSGSATLYINPLPSVTVVTSIPPAILPGQSLNIISTVNPAGGSYAWYRNGQLLTNPLQQGPVLSNITVNDLGTYRLVYTDLNGCVNSSADVVVSGLASDNLWVYPVPNDGTFQVRFFNQAGEQATVRVFDAKGAKVYERSVVTSTAYTQINIELSSATTDGMYVVELVNAAGRRVGAKQIIVRRKP